MLRATVTGVTNTVTLHTKRNAEHSVVTAASERTGTSGRDWKPQGWVLSTRVMRTGVDQRLRPGGVLLAFLVSVVAGAGIACGPRYEMHPPREPVLATHAKSEDPAFDERPIDPAGAPSESKVDQVGLASWYGSAFAGHRTANGERFDPRLFTGAHKQLPFGTWVEVRRIDTGRTVRVRINDRGPNGRAKSRIIDLSRRAAEDLDLVRAGVVRVELRVVDGP
jgi:rare lipoprotein A